MPKIQFNFIFQVVLSSILQVKAFSSNYGIPIAPPVAPVAPVRPIAPLETIDIPPQGPGILIPQERTRSFALPSNSYGIPLAPVAPVTPIAPLETIDIPENAGIILPPNSRGIPGSRLNQNYGIPIAPVTPTKPITPVTPVAPLETITLPEEVAPLVFGPVLYQYQYNTGNSARQEIRDKNGLTQGFYSYVDPTGTVQRVDYLSDPVLGYRVLPNQVIQDTPEVAKAKAEFLKVYNEALANAL